MIVYVCALPVLLLFVLHAVIVAVSERVVVVLVRVPVAPMLPLVQGVIGMVVGDVVMVVSMRSRRVGVLRLTAFALRNLANCSSGLRLHRYRPPLRVSIVLHGT